MYMYVSKKSINEYLNTEQRVIFSRVKQLSLYMITRDLNDEEAEELMKLTNNVQKAIRSLSFYPTYYHNPWYE